jgi:hypothetical protein
MADGLREEWWQHTAHQMALLANCHRQEKRRSTPFRPDDFNPHRRPARTAAWPKVPIQVLKQVFVDQRVR